MQTRNVSYNVMNSIKWRIYNRQYAWETMTCLNLSWDRVLCWGLKCFFSSTSSKDWALSQCTYSWEEFSDTEGQNFETFPWIKTWRQRKLAVWIYFLDVLLFIFVFHWVSKRPCSWRTFVLAFVASDVARHSCHLQVKWCMKVNIHLLWSKVLCDGSMMHAL